MSPYESMAEDARDAARYRKLRGWMSSNVPDGWREVERLGALAAWMDWDTFDGYLDGLPVCNLGLMTRSVNTDAYKVRHERGPLVGLHNDNPPAGVGCRYCYDQEGGCHYCVKTHWFIRFLIWVGFTRRRSDGSLFNPIHFAPAWKWKRPIVQAKCSGWFYIFRNLPEVVKWRKGRLLPRRWGFGIMGLFEFGDRE